MKKYILYNIIGLAFLAVSVISCDTAEEDVSPVVSPEGYPVATFTTEFAGDTINEGDTIIYHVSIDKTIDVDLSFSARIIGGDCVASDIDVTSGKIAAYTTEADVSIIFAKDWIAEGTETCEIEVGLFTLGEKYLVNTTTVNPTFSVNVTNYASNDLTMTFAWNSVIFVNAGYEDFPDYGWEYDAADYVDFDIFIADAEGYDNNDPWATWNSVIYAATGDSPEEMTFSGIPDGEYIIFSELWANPLAGIEEPEVATHADMPIIATFNQQGVADTSFVQDTSQTLNTADFGVGDDNYAGGVIDTFVAKVIISGNQYTIIGYNDAGVKTKRVGVINRETRPTSLNK